jgi:hypothetical protein
VANPPVLIAEPGSFSDTATYTVPGSQLIQPTSVSAVFDGSSATGSFRPTLSYYAQSGELIARTFAEDTVAAGDTAETTFAPFLRKQAASVSGSAGSYAWMHKETDWTLFSGTGETDCDSYDTSGGDLGTAFDVDLADGRINILETGVYLFAVGALVSAFPPAVPARIEIGLNTDTSVPRFGRFPAEISPTFTPGILDISNSMMVIVQILFGAPDDYIQGNIAQDSGGDATVARFDLMAQKIRDL